MPIFNGVESLEKVRLEETINKGARDDGKSLLVILVVAVIAIGLVCFSYVANFSGGISPKHSVWGEFGDFIGGTLNPIFGFLTIVALLLTIKLQISEMKQARAAAECSASALARQCDLAHMQVMEGSFFRFLESIENDRFFKRCKEKQKI